MKFQHIVAAAAIALAPVAASAVTFVNDGETHNITSGDEFIGNVVGAGGAGSWEVRFDSLLDPLNGIAAATIGPIVSGTFTNLVMSWISVATGTVLSTVAVVPDSVSIATTFVSPDDLSQYLNLSWDNSLASAGFDVEVNAVPLPAAGWLLVSALGGMGYLSRRRKAA